MDEWERGKVDLVQFELEGLDLVVMKQLLLLLPSFTLQKWWCSENRRSFIVSLLLSIFSTKHGIGLVDNKMNFRTSNSQGSGHKIIYEL